MDTVTLLLDRDQANSQDFRNRIQRFRGQIQHLTGVERDHVEHIEKLSGQFYEATTKARQEAILRKITRTQRGLALIREMINFHEEDTRLEEENQRRRREEIVNIVNRFLSPTGFE